MKKTLALAVSLAVSAPLYAVDHAAAMKADHAPHSISSIALDKVEGMPTYDASGEKFGDVDRVVTHGGQRMVIIGIDGVIGDGAKEIAVPFGSLSLSPDNSHVIVNNSAAALRALPDVDPGDYRDVLKDGAPAPVAKGHTHHHHAKASWDIEGMDVLGPNGEQVGDIDRVVIKDGVRTAIIGIDGILGDNAKEVAVPLSKLARTLEGEKLRVDYTQEQLKAMPDVDPGDFPAIDVATGNAKSSHQPKSDKHQASRWHNLEGKAVYSYSGEKIGDVDRLVMKDGKRTAIIGIDGIFGDGAKEVAVPLSKVMRSVDSDHIIVNYTEADLKAMPDVDPGDFVAINKR